jgi:hypothetical protein
MAVQPPMACDTGRVHHGQRIGRKIVEPHVVDRARRTPPAALVEQQRAVPRGEEGRDLLEPFQRVAAAAVGKRHGRPALAVDLVVEFGLLGGDVWHDGARLD